MALRELALFAGAGGGILGGHLLGWRTVAACEIEDYPRETLLRRQIDGILPRFPIWDDVKTFDGKPWRGKVDIVTGGFPCTDISAAGKGAGITGERSGLWTEMARIIGEIRPRYAFMENSPMLTSRGLGTVLGDLAALGYDARWCILGAHHAGAPHKRDRIWILAYPGYGSGRDIGTTQGREIPSGERATDTGPVSGPSGEPAAMANPDELNGNDGRHGTSEIRRERSETAELRRSPGWWAIDPAELPDTDGEQKGRATISRGKCDKWPIESRVGRVAHGVAHRTHRLKALGNGQVPAVVALTFTILSEGIY